MSTDKNNVILIKLDREYELRYGHKALKMMLANMNINLEEFEIDGNDLEQVEKIVYYGIMADARRKGIDLKLEDMEDLLDECESYGEIIDKVGRAIQKAFDRVEQDAKNVKRVAAARK